MLKVKNFNVNEQVAKYEKEMKEAIERAVIRYEKSVSNNLLGYQLLASEGFNVGELDTWNLAYGSEYNVTSPEEWKKIHNALGRLVKNGDPIPTGDGRSRTVKVGLQPADEQFSNLRFYYNKKLPKGNKSNCKIRTVVRKERVLVCDN